MKERRLIKMTKQYNQDGLAPVIIVIALLVLVASGVTFWNMTNKSEKSQKALTSLRSDLPKDLTGMLSVEKIKELTLAEKADATIKQIELEMIDSVLVYKVQLLDGTLLAFNAKDGSKVALSQDEKSEAEEDNLPPNTAVSITFEKAIEIARTKYPDKTIRKVEFELENGAVVYSIRFTDGSRVDVNANTGEIAQAKDSLVEDKDRDDDGIEDDNESESNKESDPNKKESSQESSSSKSDDSKNEESDGDDDSDEKEDNIEYKESRSDKKQN